MEDKIIQISGFGVENNQSTQCSYMIVGLTESGKVLITRGDGEWADINPKASQPSVQADAENRCLCEETWIDVMKDECPWCGRQLRTA